MPGRIKPDVVAPGSAILGARSKDLSPNNVAAYRHHGVWADTNYMFSTGTSMATPLVAGCCAGIREAIGKMKVPFKKPSAALVKALVINGTVDCQGNRGGRIIPPAPNGIQVRSWRPMPTPRSVPELTVHFVTRDLVVLT